MEYKDALHIVTAMAEHFADTHPFFVAQWVKNVGGDLIEVEAALKIVRADIER